MPTLLSDRYRLDELIGGGGMGEVWRARDHVLDRDVAVKIIRSHLADSENIRARLRVEARLAGSLHHPGIVDVFDYGEHRDGDRTVPYVVMPLIDGEPLSHLLDASRQLTTGQTMAIVAEVAAALQASHDAGIVHRDLKPGNILLARRGRVMLVDFGIARAADSEPLTETGTLLGTVSYLSPEQCEGRPATASSDLYALGVVAYACLTGTLPFDRESDIATALAHIQAPLPSLPPAVPEPVRDLVLALLAKDPAERPASASEVAAVAREQATSLPDVPGSDETVRTSAVSMTQAAGRGTSVLEVDAGPVARSTRPYVLTGVAAVVAVVAGLLFMSTRDDGAEVPSLKGDTVTAATAELKTAGLKARTKDVDAADARAGEVVSQSPAAGTAVDEDSVVTVSVATGRVRVPADDLLGSTYDNAADQLDEVGLVAKRVEATSSKPAGTVIAVDPSSRARSGATVELTVAQAPVATDATEDGDPLGGKRTNGKGKGKKPK